MKKRILLSILFGLSTVFGSTAALTAGNSVEAVPVSESGDTAAMAAPADTLTVPVVPAPAVAATDSLLQALGERLAGVERTIAGWTPDTNFLSAKNDNNGEYVMIVSVVAVCATALVMMVFIWQKYRYRRREKEYELQRLRIERGELLVGGQSELPLTVFIRRLLIFGIGWLIVLAWIGFVNLSYMRFFASLLLWMLIVGVGYAVVYLFRLYVQRRDDNR